ncbi:hypothetical protein TSAR_007793, partial [Trichomalopsis sarcophagae]
VKSELISELKRIKEHQRNDAQIQRFISKKSPSHAIHSENDVYFVKNKNKNSWKLLLPLSLALMTFYLSRFFYWRGMRRAVKAYTKSCNICQRVKYLNCKIEGGYQFLHAKKPSKIVSVDFFGPLPCSVGLCLEPVGVSVLFSSIRQPQSNPHERSMSEIGRIFRTYCTYQHTKWGRQVNFVQQCINLTTHQSTDYTPYFLHFNEQPKERILELFPILRRVSNAHEFVIESANENIKKAFKTRCKTQKTVSRVKIKVDDEVMLRVPHLSDATQHKTSKFFHIYEGPYKVSRVIGENAFELISVDDHTQIKGTYNRYNLRKYHRQNEESGAL